MNNRTLTIKVLQFHVEAGNVDANHAKVEQLLTDAVRTGNKPDVILLPEMWNTGYALDRIHEIADTDGQRTKRQLSAFSRAHAVTIIAGSIAERSGDDVRNTSYVFDPRGEIIADYSKIHLFRLMEEEKYLTAGEHTGELQLDGVPAGLLICYDIRFPELTRKLALGGAKLLFVPAQWPKPRLHHWRTLMMARAIENQMIVIACNTVGVSNGSEFFGHSMIVDPWGEIVAEAGEDETILETVLDLSLVDEVRGRIPVFEDRRPQLY